MKWSLIIVFVLLSYVVQSQQLDINIKAPEEVYSGSDFIVNVHVTKAKLRGFGRLLVKIPSGFTPNEKKSARGKFEFTDNKIKVIWLELPDEKNFTVTFALKAPPNMEGFQVIRAEMNVGTESGAVTAEARPHIVTVKKTDNITTTDSVVFQYSYIKEMGVSAIRQKPYLNDSGQAIVNILVNKGDLTGFGKIEETIPPGYMVESLKSNGAIFVYNKNNRKIKFLWMNMPQIQHYIISYKLIPEKGSLENIPFIITGSFLYAEGSTTKEVDLMERNIDLKKMLSE